MVMVTWCYKANKKLVLNFQDCLNNFPSSISIPDIKLLMHLGIDISSFI